MSFTQVPVDTAGETTTVASLELDLDVFSGPFDLLLTLVLREEVDLLELQLAEIVLAYLDHLQQQPDDSRAAQKSEAGRRARGEREELDLETATEFIVLIAALLELKSRLMLSGEEEEMLDLEPGQAAEELLARMLDARRYRSAAEHLGELLAREHGVRFRAAPLPESLRRTIFAQGDGGTAADPAVRAVCPAGQDPQVLGQAIGRLLLMPPAINVRHIAAPRVTVAERLAHLRGLLHRGTFSFDDAVQGADRMTVAVTLFALLELYKSGEATWEQQESFGEIAVHARPPAPIRVSPSGRMPQPARPPLALAAAAASAAGGAGG
jgi:segregation and condensation protein A